MSALIAIKGIVEMNQGRESYPDHISMFSGHRPYFEGPEHSVTNSGETDVVSSYKKLGELA